MKPVFYHCISRVVDRKFAFGVDEKEKFRALMRMYEKFSGCRVVSYCLMCNHIHLLLEVPPMPAGGLSDAQLLDRLEAIYSEAFVALVEKELQEARTSAMDERATEIHQRFTYRMHDLSQFMKTLMQRFTQWFNRTRKRSGNLWEDAFKSVIVEDGIAAKTMAAYIDLNPVRAGMVKDPADYRWSSYGEAIGGGAKGNGKKARAGLVRALRAHLGTQADATHWDGDVAKEYRRLLMEGIAERVSERVAKDGKMVSKTLRKGMTREQAAGQKSHDGEIPLGKMLRCRVRYFSEGAVIGSRAFVNAAFAGSREHATSKRKNGARKLRGPASAASEVIWSFRDLKKNMEPASKMEA
ncbi:MAG: transposase [Luteolibacter sp.]